LFKIHNANWYKVHWVLGRKPNKYQGGKRDSK